MKSTKSTTCPASTQVPERTSLFKSIVDNELLQLREVECQRLSNRVAIISKVLVNRKLDELSHQFTYMINDLVEDFANRIDNELYKTEKDA